MKKKQIEKIAYLKLEKTTRKKGVKYIGVTDNKNVAHERHFFLEVYENKKTGLDVPVVRIVCTKNDFATYFPGKDEWSRQKIRGMYRSDGLIWESRENRSRTLQDRKKANLLFNESDLERIEAFFKDTKVWSKEEWWEFIYWQQNHIVCQARIKAQHRKYERRQLALKEREENTAELPEQTLLEMADERFFQNKHYLFYKLFNSFYASLIICIHRNYSRKNSFFIFNNIFFHLFCFNLFCQILKIDSDCKMPVEIAKASASVIFIIHVHTNYRSF